MNMKQTANVSKIVSSEWKNLSNERRKCWQEMAKEDKERFETERKNYKGPWVVPTKQRGPRKKNPWAPKRPVSAFFTYSNSRKASLRRKNPSLTNADLSRLLSIKWKELPTEERQKYLDEEAKSLAKHKVAMKEFFEKEKQEKEQQKAEQEEAADCQKRKEEKVRALSVLAMPATMAICRESQCEEQICGMQTDVNLPNCGAAYPRPFKQTSLPAETPATTLSHDSLHCRSLSQQIKWQQGHSVPYASLLSTQVQHPEGYGVPCASFDD